MPKRWLDISNEAREAKKQECRFLLKTSPQCVAPSVPRSAGHTRRWPRIPLSRHQDRGCAGGGEEGCFSPWPDLRQECLTRNCAACGAHSTMPTKYIGATRVELNPYEWRGAGDGNRTHVFSLEGCCSTIELHPRPARYRPGRGGGASVASGLASVGASGGVSGRATARSHGPLICRRRAGSQAS